MSQERIDLLESIEFVWSPLEQQWNDTFQELKEFYKREGASKLHSHSINLAKWRSRQRNAYTQRKLSQEKIDYLESIEGWQW